MQREAEAPGAATTRSRAWMPITAAAALVIAAMAAFAHPPMLRDWAIGLLCAVGATLLGLWAWGRCASAEGGATRALNRRYLREFLPAMLLYLAALFLSVWLLKRVDALALRAAIALLPVPAIVLAMRAIVRYIRDADELQRQIELEALGIATGFVSLLYLTGGFLQAARVIDVPADAAMIWVFPLVCGCYGFAKLVVSRRFR